MKLAGVRRLIHKRVLDSTQNEARRLAEAGAPDGTLVWADRQTAGRGRLGRKWRSAKGGLYASWLLRPKFPPARLAEMSPAFAEALADALRELDAPVAIKPPNDVYAFCDWDSKGRKIAGVLCEASGGGGRLDWLIVGFGINVNADPPLARATSLRAIVERRVPVARVLLAAMKHLSRARRAGHFL